MSSLNIINKVLATLSDYQIRRLRPPTVGVHDGIWLIINDINIATKIFAACPWLDEIRSSSLFCLEFERQLNHELVTVFMEKGVRDLFYNNISYYIPRIMESSLSRLGLYDCDKVGWIDRNALLIDFPDIVQGSLNGNSYEEIMKNNPLSKVYEDRLIDIIIELVTSYDLDYYETGNTEETFEARTYRNRQNTAEQPPEFLQRIYGKEIEEGTLTLADLRLRDESLWRGLRNYARTRKIDLSELIPKGSATRGRKLKDAAIDAELLDPSDPRDEALLAEMRRRKLARERMRRARQEPKPR